MRRGIVVGALTVAMLTTLPIQAAVGAKPSHLARWEGTRDYEVAPAGEPCPFAVGIQAEGQGIDMQFSPERGVSNNQSTWTFTNLETGTSYVHRSIYHYTSDWLLGGDTIHEVMDGTYFLGMLSGDQGPEGEVGPNGAMYFIEGRFTITYDVPSDLITSFEWSGSVQDVCEVLA